MDGPELVARTMSVPRGKADDWGNMWQYHPRSDRHSKAACWAIAFDVLRSSALVREHFAAGKVVLGVNHRMTDFTNGRKKDLDLVIARPGGNDPSTGGATLATLAGRWNLALTQAQMAELAALPTAPVAPVGSVLVAVEAKAAMTAHVRALPRLYDELNSSHLTVHGASEQALAAGFAMVNASSTFISPGLNRHALDQQPPIVSRHRQPNDAERAIDKVKQIPRRAGAGQGIGFDALGIVVVDIVNDGSPVQVVTVPPAPPPGDAFGYDGMVGRLVHQYEVAFQHI